MTLRLSWPNGRVPFEDDSPWALKRRAAPWRPSWLPDWRAWAAAPEGEFALEGPDARVLSSLMRVLRLRKRIKGGRPLER
jgi:hypothetical protein